MQAHDMESWIWSLNTYGTKEEIVNHSDILFSLINYLTVIMMMIGVLNGVIFKILKGRIH